MINLIDIEKYQIYLSYLDKKLKEFFEEQSPYIFCKEGCSHCCEDGEYPMSKIEFLYLISGINKLTPDIVIEIEKKIFELKNAKDLHNNNEKFRHECPFLHKNKCSVYQNRPIICRTHGLAFFSKDEQLLVPNCVSLGLNYSNVYDFDTKKLSAEKFEKLNIEQEPLAHNVGLSFMTNNEITKKIGLAFGEIKPLHEWILSYLEQIKSNMNENDKSE